ncbi:arfaptin-2 [Lingula anatina]|uniref:Arfaptin-2 n=1 Tax=Lingula anatina TaxID=7574 RepID=A0A1S3KBW9_LINAN|nr:arfaptin-2-like [Lingula anatina]XP_013419755.1 arfaptin-2 [Lingula anatina]XP_013419756.1 arfaptin-2 [Lingula anatina]XP_013419758.1 arfaptin-2 [Lingula anatina]XP_013419759.1 arfaptin-2 [Lingula anatina]|eukprot:XP_013399640.1 arfaptin-2-like [Lingula anatina]
MAESQTSQAVNGIEDDRFEQDLKEMLRDGPVLNDSSSTVQSGAMTKVDSVGPASIKPPLYTAGMQRSQTFPTSTGSPNMSARNGGGTNPPRPFSQTASSKLDSIKEWSLNTFKCTKQLLAERLGKGSRTVDLELESKIEVLRDTQRRYSNVLKLSRALTNHFYHVVQTQRALGEDFAELAQKSPELQEEFNYNSETQKALVRNGETLLGALNFFTSSINTLINKTMEDSLETIKQYEAARIEYDAYRTDLDTLQLGPKNPQTIPRLEEAKRKFQLHKDKFDKLRENVSVKLQFLDENKIKVMHKQLLLFHNAISAYFSGNQSALDTTLKQFNIKLKPTGDSPSWLEQ